MLAQLICRGYHLQNGPPRCAIKLDVHKAFDSLNWGFLFTALERMGFPRIFIQWLRKCISSTMVFIKINEELEGYFQCKSRLRQGDPLSPSLFVIIMKIFTACIQKHTQSTSFLYHRRTSHIKLSHLNFTDDVLLFSKGDISSIEVRLDGVAQFSNISGLRPNASKCSFFFENVNTGVITETLRMTGFKQGTLPIKYLGLPLITKKLTVRDCTP